MTKIEAKDIELVGVNTLIPHPKNMNEHSPEQIERLCKLIEYQGFRNPIVVQKGTNLIVAGHGRIMAAKKMGIEKVPVTYQEFESDAQLYAYMVSDNAIASWAELDLGAINTEMLDFGPDFDVDLLGLENFTIELPSELAPGDPDGLPDALPDPKVVRGEVYILGKHRLMCGDSTAITDVEKLIDGGKLDMVYTDPPYGIDVVSSNGSIGGEKAFGSIGGDKATKPGVYMSIKGDDTIETAVDAFNLCAALEIPEMIFWGANYYASALPSRKAWIVWDKQTTGNFSDCELAWCSREGAVKRFTHLWNGMIKGSERGDKRVHPTQKPIALAEWCFENYGDPSSVLDLFGGSGSTLIACEKTKRSCYMMEFEPHYCQVILDRWQKFTGKKAHREDGVSWDEIRGGANG